VPKIGAREPPIRTSGALRHAFVEQSADPVIVTRLGMALESRTTLFIEGVAAHSSDPISITVANTASPMQEPENEEKHANAETRRLGNWSAIDMAGNSFECKTSSIYLSHSASSNLTQGVCIMVYMFSKNDSNCLVCKVSQYSGASGC
jgi:hypothetical protein